MYSLHNVLQLHLVQAFFKIKVILGYFSKKKNNHPFLLAFFLFRTAWSLCRFLDPRSFCSNPCLAPTLRDSWRTKQWGGRCLSLVPRSSLLFQYEVSEVLITAVAYAFKPGDSARLYSHMD